MDLCKLYAIILNVHFSQIILMITLILIINLYIQKLI